MLRIATTVRGIILTAWCATAAAADPATRSSLPWLVEGGGPVARAGRTLFFGNAITMVPRANRSSGMVVFSEAESVGEPIAAASPLIFTAIPDGAGGWYAGGSFQEGAVTRGRVVHVLPDGRIDPAFVVDLGSANAVLARSLTLNGRQLIVAGTFTTVNQVARTGLAWVDATTGQVLPTASVLTGRLAVQSGSTLFLVTQTGLFAINVNTGAAISSFTPAVADGPIQTVTVDQRFVYLGGSFTTVGGLPRANLVRVDGATGTVDSSWNPGASAGSSGGQVSGLVVSGGVVYVGGTFSIVGGQPRNSVAAVATTTGVVTPWRADTDGSVFGLAVQAGAVYITGGFGRVAGLLRRNAAAVSVSSPAAVLPWDPSTNVGVGVAAGAGRVAVFGAISGWGGLTRRKLAAVDAVTGDLLPWTPDFGAGGLRDIVVAGTRLIVGGVFTTVDGQPRRQLAMFDLETRALLAPAPAVTGEVRALAVANDVLYVGGLFSAVDGSARSNLAAIDLRSGLLLPWNPAANGAVNDIVVRGANVIVGGEFTALADSPVARQRIGVGEITAAGAITALTVNIAPGGVVNALLADDSTLFVGGDFSVLGLAGGGTRANAAAVALATSAVLPWDPMADAVITHMGLHGGFVYLQGAFNSVGGVPRRGLARVTAGDGTLSGWQVASAQPSFSRIGGLAVFDDGLLLSTRGLQGASESDDGRFLPEESMVGVPGPPAAPIARVGGATLALTFEPPVSGPRPASYLLEAGSAPTLRNIGTIPLTATTFAAPGVPPGVYYVRVRAVGPAGVGPASRELAVVVGATSCTTAPAAPDVPTATVNGASLVVSWQPSPGSPPASYTLQAGSSAGLTNIATLPMGAGTSFAVSAVPAGVYFLRVTAANGCGESAASPEAAARVGGAPGPPGAPLQFAGSARAGVVSLAWLTSSGGAPSSHLLEVGSGPTLRNLGTISLGPSAAFSAGGVPPGIYYLRVRAANDAGVSLPSGELVLVVP